jgi:epoxide hydrolase-like predicted phosphatase
MTTRAVIFDFGNVLDYDEHYDQWLEFRDNLVKEHFNMGGHDFWCLAYQTDPWQRTKKGKLSYEDFWNEVLTPLGMTDRLKQQKFIERLFEGRDKVHPDMDRLVRELRPHYQLAILSNTFRIEMESWIADAHGLVGMFDTVVSSAKVGMAKPEPEIYQLTLDRLNVQPGEALFIDDLVRNTNAAEALGIPSIVFESPAQLRAELEARHVLPVS